MGSSKNFLKLPFTNVVNIRSLYNKQEYNLFIRIPDDYYLNNKNYPILLVLDPNFLFSALYGINSIAQNYIICSIGHQNVDFSDLSLKEKSNISEIVRSRDFLPFKLDPNIFIKDAPRDLVNRILQCTGKADDFILFIKNQVISFLENNFRTNNERLILGHSFGVFLFVLLYCNIRKFLIVILLYFQLLILDIILKKKCLVANIHFLKIIKEKIIYILQLAVLKMMIE